MTDQSVIRVDKRLLAYTWVEVKIVGSTWVRVRMSGSIWVGLAGDLPLAIDYRELPDNVVLRWEQGKEIPKRVKEVMESQCKEVLRLMHQAHPEYVFCLSMECWGRKMPPTTLTANLQEGSPPCGST